MGNTANRAYPTPEPANELSDDVVNLKQAFVMIDADVAAILLSLAGKAAADHAHALADITGLVAALAGKAAVNHKHNIADLEGTAGLAGATNGQILYRTGSGWAPGDPGDIIAAHVHTIAQITGLQAALNAKATTTSVTNLTAALNALAQVARSGSYADLSGLPALGTAAAMNTGTADGQVVLLGTGGALPAVDGSNLINLRAMGLPDLWVRDEKSSGTDGGNFPAGADQTRTLNTIKRRTLGSLSSSNRFTLPAGNFYISWRSPGMMVGPHQSLLFNYTAGAEVERGSSAMSHQSGSYASSDSIGSAVVTLTANTAFEIRHRGTYARNGNGFGNAAGFGTEVYAEVMAWKV